MNYDIVSVIQVPIEPNLTRQQRGEFAAGLWAHIADYFEEKGLSPVNLDVVVGDAHLEMRDGGPVAVDP